MLSCVAASQSDQAVWSGRRAGKRREESLSSFQAIDGWSVKQCYQGFLTALHLFCRHYALVTSLPEEQARHGRAAPFGMT